MSFKASIRKSTAVLFFGILHLTLQAQDSLEYAMSSFQEVITEIAARSDEGTNIDELSNMLYDLAANPVSVNTAGDEDFERLFWLNEFQIQGIRQYIFKFGPLASKFELSYIPALSAADAKLLSVFLTFDMSKKEFPVKPVNILQYGRHRLVLRSMYIPELQKGYKSSQDSSNHFTGSRPYYYCRYNYRLNSRLYLGFTAEKDAGEQFFSGSNKSGFDFYSFYVQVNKLKFLKTFVLGDYRINFGQGLTAWSGFNFGKSVSVMNTLPHSSGINYYQSLDENNFFRGMAFTLDFKPLDVSFWYSSNRVDANITGVDTIIGDVTEVSSLQTYGIHATPSDIKDENAIRAKVLGSNITFNKGNFRSGITAMYEAFSAYLNPMVKPYNYYFFRGRSNYNLSVDYRYRTGNLIFFGEGAISQNGGVAVLDGIQSYVSSRLSFNILGRYYQRHYQALYGKAFGENTRNNNETGVYAGFECKPLNSVSLSAYLDVFSFPWITYGADMPSSGRDFMMQLTVNPSNRLQMYVQFRNKNKEQNDSTGSEQKNQIDRVISKRLRYNLIYTVNDHITWRNRLEMAWYNTEISAVTKGYYLGQGIEIIPGKLPLKIYLQYALFDTDDYNSRIYAYESDLLGTFSIPVFSGKGSRTSIMLKYSPVKEADIWIKYGITQYTNIETIGTGPYEIDGNHKSELKVEVLLKF
jgi:hypothetical protein